MEIDVRQILLQVLNFGVLYFVLSRFLFKPVLNILDQRAKRVEEGMAAAKKSLEEHEKFEAKKLAEMEKVEKKAAQIISDAREESKKMAAEILAAGREESAKMSAKKEAELDSKLQDMKGELEAQMGKMVVETTKALLSDSLTASEVNTISRKMGAKLK